MTESWRHIGWQAIAGLSSFAIAVLLLVVEGIRTTRFDLLAAAVTCLFLGSLALAARHGIKGGA